MKIGAIGIIAVLSWPAGQRPAESPRHAPATEIYLAPFVEGPPKNTRIGFITVQRSGVKVETPVNITSSAGADDEPNFLPDSSGLLFVSNRDGAQSDIYRYDFASKAITRVTNTPDDESSPIVAADGRSFTVVRGADRRLWRFTLAGADVGAADAGRGSIGGYAWISPSQLAVTVPGVDGKPNTLELVDLASATTEIVASDVGRSLLMSPKLATLTFIQRREGGVAFLKEVELGTRKVTALMTALAGSDDHTWTPGGLALMAVRSKIFMAEIVSDRWIEIADLKDAGVRAITRLAVSPDAKWIALVSDPTLK